MAAQDTGQTQMTGWTDLLRGGLARYTVTLTLGVLLFGTDIYLIQSIMPSVIADVDGIRFYTWTLITFSVGSIIGASSAEPIRRSFGRRNGYAIAGMVFVVGTIGATSSGRSAALIT